MLLEPPRPRAVLAADGCEKGYHWSNAGRAQSNVSPSCRQFFAGPNDTVLEQARNRTLPNFAKQLGDSEEGEAAKLCATELRCSRSLAAPRGETDRTGVVGCACGHTIPAKSLFLDMPTPEQHYFYDLVFKQVK